jgi:general secretion pathway protein J
MRENGFTLLEVLLATTILGVVMAMLSLGLAATLRVVEATEQQEEVYYLAQTALRRITEDLAATSAAPEGIFVGRNNEIRGRRADSLVFTSQAHLVFNPEKQLPGAATIRYTISMDPDDERLLKLVRSDVRVLPGVLPVTDTTDDPMGDPADEPAFLLADNLRAVKFDYFNRTGQEFDSWQKEPGSGEGLETVELPAAVQCTLEFWLDADKDIFQSFSTGILILAETHDAH